MLRLRYIDCESWNDIVDLMFGDCPDLLEKEDVYLRRAFKVHTRALHELAKILQLETGQEKDI